MSSGLSGLSYPTSYLMLSWRFVHFCRAYFFIVHTQCDGVRMHCSFGNKMPTAFADICPWHRRIVPAARRGEVEVADLPLPSNQQAEPAFAEFDKNWDEAVASGEPKLMKVRAFAAKPTGAHAAIFSPLALLCRLTKQTAVWIQRRICCAGWFVVASCTTINPSPPPLAAAGAHQDLRSRCLQGWSLQAPVVCVCHHGR
jgi:hypothetical protein